MDVAESQRKELACQRCLVYTLLVWITILSLALATTLALILTAPQPPPSPTPTASSCNVPSQVVIMENGNSKEKRDVLPWVQSEVNTGEEPLSVKGKHLEVNFDGHYFLYLQVTLQTADPPKVAPIVRVKQGDRTLLESVLTKRDTSGALTTGFLGRQVDLSRGKNITVSSSSASSINTTDTATYLGVILLYSQ